MNEKRDYLLVVIAMSVILAACGADNDQKESILQPDIEVSGNEAEESLSKIELSQDGTEMAKDAAENILFPEHDYETDIIYYNEASDGQMILWSCWRHRELLRA